MIWVRSTLVCCLAVSAAIPCAAKEPLSAIPWLSDDLPTPSRPTPRPKGSTTAPVSEIEITPLQPLEKEGIGILPPSATGLPRDLWKGLSELRVRGLVTELPDTGVPSSRALFARILLAQTQAPKGSAEGDTLLVARMDRLINAGRLAEADALASASGNQSTALFKRIFNIGLLTGEIDVVCKALLGQADQPTLAAQRIYCLGTLGQWQDAEATLKASTDITAPMADLLARFLDPDAYETTEPPKGEAVQSVLEYRIRQTLGQPRRSARPSLALRYVDLSGYAGLRQRILAAEALVSAGALPANVLFTAYRDSAPAASGGAWDRAAAAQDLDEGIANGDWEAALVTAQNRFQNEGLLPALADEYARALSQAPAPSDKAANDARGLLLALGGAFQDPKDQNWPRATTEAHALANQSLSPNATPRAKAAAAGLAGQLPATEPANRMRELIEAEQTGAALMRALKLLSAGPRIDPDDLQIALYAIAASNLTQEALMIAVETLVLGNTR